jgi:hypothetical protein
MLSQWRRERTRIKLVGGKYVKADELWGVCTIPVILLTSH